MFDLAACMASSNPIWTFCNQHQLRHRARNAVYEAVQTFRVGRYPRAASFDGAFSRDLHALLCACSVQYGWPYERAHVTYADMPSDVSTAQLHDRAVQARYMEYRGLCPAWLDADEKREALATLLRHRDVLVEEILRSAPVVAGARLAVSGSTYVDTAKGDGNGELCVQFKYAVSALNPDGTRYAYPCAEWPAVEAR